MSTALAKIEKANDKFVAIYQAVHKVDEEKAQQFYEVEKFNFMRQVQDSNDLSECDEISTVGVFLEVISNGLSFEKSAGHIYLMSRNSNSGTREKPIWTKKMSYSYAAQGLIFLCTAAGSIEHCTPPVLVFEGDHIDVNNFNGRVTINHKQAIPRKSNKLLGGYCFISLKREREGFWFDITGIERLAKFSEKQNKGKANDLYHSGIDGQVDEGFLKTKIVKAALKNYRKKKTIDINHMDDEAIEEEVPLLQEEHKALFDEELPTVDPTTSEKQGELAF